MKSNPLSRLIKDTIEAGCGADCASRDELRTALEHGLSPADIVYSNVVKAEGDLVAANGMGIQLTTADTIEEAEKVQALAPGMRMLWRISISEDPRAGITTCFSNKFGDNINSP
jgi:diaminopimelate decarboxylase